MLVVVDETAIKSMFVGKTAVILGVYLRLGWRIEWKCFALKAQDRYDAS